MPVWGCEVQTCSEGLHKDVVEQGVVLIKVQDAHLEDEESGRDPE